MGLKIHVKEQLAAARLQAAVNTMVTLRQMPLGQFMRLPEECRTMCMAALAIDSSDLGDYFTNVEEAYGLIRRWF
tara:strand:+ start:1113 stop:1337 length:225 start_codon:yes stop_codon:yes gene_type:complete